MQIAWKNEFKKHYLLKIKMISFIVKLSYSKFCGKDICFLFTVEGNFKIRYTNSAFTCIFYIWPSSWVLKCS